MYQEYRLGEAPSRHSLLAVLFLVATSIGATSCSGSKDAEREGEAVIRELREAGDPTWSMIDSYSKLAANLAADDFDCATDPKTRQVEASITVTNDEDKKRSYEFTIGVESENGRIRYGSSVLSIKNVGPGESKTGDVEFIADEMPDGSVCRMQSVE